MRDLLKKIIYSSIEFVKADKDGYTTISVLRGPTKGMQLRLQLQKESAYFLGKYDTHLFELVKKIAKPDWTLWDCGIYLGIYSLFFAKITNKGSGQVIAFEPDKVNLVRSQNHMKLNNFNNITFVDVAIADVNGELEFIVDGNTNSHLPIGWIGEKKEDYYNGREVIKERIKVKANTLNTMSDLYGMPNFIKIDIEGAEITALDHAKKLTDARKTVFLIESHNPETDERIFRFAKDANYSLRQADTPQYPLIISVEDSKGTMLAYPKEMLLGIE